MKNFFIYLFKKPQNNMLQLISFNTFERPPGESK